MFPQECCDFVISPSLLLRLKLITGFSEPPAEVQGHNKNARLPELNEVLLPRLKHTFSKGYSFFLTAWVAFTSHCSCSLAQIWVSISNCAYQSILGPSALLWFVVSKLCTLFSHHQHSEAFYCFPSQLLPFHAKIWYDLCSLNTFLQGISSGQKK